MYNERITTNLGDLADFLCLCGEKLTVVWDAGDTECHCGRVWCLQNQLVFRGQQESEAVSKPPAKLRIVLAGSYSEYNSWVCETNNSREEYRFVYRPQHIRGLDNNVTEIVRVGTWTKNPLAFSNELRVLEQQINKTKRQESQGQNRVEGNPS